MQKIVLFIEPQEREHRYYTPSKIGTLFMNRFGFDEDACHEILKIIYLDNSYLDYRYGELTKAQGPECKMQLTNKKSKPNFRW